ncbi:MAG: prepilin peptidase [Helicobacteraceae bacterium]|jgi:leader peptidase (prepilin peptidase)/N-methyltransferase|nr:prepilin peptidase [Helicobacteraceae bacterium]
MEIYVYFAVSVIGLCFGSFANVVIIRLGKNESVVFPASHCPKCKNPLRWFHNIPVFSFIFLRGKCAFCGEKISVIYPIVEIITSLLFCAAFYKLGVSYWTVFAALTLFALLCLSVIDFQTMMAPDSLNFLAFFFALLTSGDILTNLQAALLIAGALTLLRMGLSSALKKEAMGEADIILGATMGAFLGLFGAFLALFLAALLAIIPALINKKGGQSQTPFIPFLALGTLIVFLFDKRLFSLFQF